MKRIVQQRSTMHYMSARGRWGAARKGALEFRSLAAAAAFCTSHGIKDGFDILIGDGASMELRLDPVVELAV
jgi:hypothetical protein